MKPPWSLIPVWFSLAACEPAPPEAAPEAVAPIPVERATAEARKIPASRHYLGTLLPDRSARLAADANGRVTAVRVDRGSAVRAGDVLVEVDPALSALSAKAAEAQAALARAQWTSAKADCARIDTLGEGGAVSAAQVERSRAGCEAQAQAVQAAESQARLAGTQLARATVRAPFDGVVAERMVQVGEFVGAASPVMLVMTLDPLRVRFSVPERDLPFLQVGGAVVVEVPAANNARVEGRILPLPPSAREAQRDLVIEAELPNPDGALRAGLSAQVQVVQGEVDGVVVPATALIADDTVHHLWTIHEGRAVEHLVHIDATLGDLVAVSPGVAVGDVVIVNPSGLRDGASVE